MAKKIVSVAVHKKKPMNKHSNKRRVFMKTAIKKILNYMKSNTYMFAPLLNRQSYLASASASFGKVIYESVKRKEKKFGKEYLKYDCYMYAPLVMDSASDSASLLLGDQSRGNTETGRVCDPMEPRMEETTTQEGNTLNSLRDMEDNDSYSPADRIVVKHKRVQMKTVKHVVQQTCRSPSTRGQVSSQKTSRKIVLE